MLILAWRRCRCRCRLRSLSCQRRPETTACHTIFEIAKCGDCRLHELCVLALQRSQQLLLAGQPHTFEVLAPQSRRCMLILCAVASRSVKVLFAVARRSRKVLLADLSGPPELASRERQRQESYHRGGYCAAVGGAQRHTLAGRGSCSAVAAAVQTRTVCDIAEDLLAIAATESLQALEMNAR